MHHHTIQINQTTRCNSFRSLLFDVCVWLNMFRAPLRPLSGAYNCTRSLWFYRWSVAVAHHQELNNCSSSLWFYLRSVVIAVLLVVVCQTTTNNAENRPDHDQQHCYRHAPKVKPEAATAVVELLMMGLRTPETC